MTPLTPHELELVLASGKHHLVAHLPPEMQKSRTAQAVLSELSQAEFDQVKLASSFAELMDMVGKVKSLRGLERN